MMVNVAIPSFIQGISTDRSKGLRNNRNPVAIPSFIQGISTYGNMLNYNIRIFMSQSLPLFRAFQQGILDVLRRVEPLLVAIPSFIQGISTRHREVEGIPRRQESQSLPLFRAFQL